MTEAVTAEIVVAPKCVDCGHEPCPHCMDWCDTVTDSAVCLECESVQFLRPFVGPMPQVCPQCGSALEYDMDLCCDGECRWDQPGDQVAAWCENWERVEP